MEAGGRKADREGHLLKFKLKSLMEKGTEPKMEMMKMLKPEEVLSCR